MTAENEVIRDLAETAATRTVIDLVPGRLAGVLHGQGQVLHEVDLEEFEDAPFRKTGTVELGGVDSFGLYVNRHQVADATTLWADVDAGTVTAVIDDHVAGAELAGWGQHRAILALAETPDWEHWLALDGKMVAQGVFAEHIEFGAGSVKEPSAADMLEIAQTFHAKSGVDFQSGIRLSSGETQLQYVETVAARVGQKGSVEVPASFTLALQPFHSSDAYEVLARFRYRINGGNLQLGYRLVRPDLARRQAFDDLCAGITTATNLPVLSGRPRS